ncbi:lytic transglycosylase domain-containing protein [Streptomyces lancefieldiae]|uniref:Lytic murein transglycosylase n=1 Tax=Streptomyces lancefieldiae TaxID=3075520 RepID=A0ABU3APD3_9ACTN|nr:lytic murein transglycosylase [Streptomyces sp. DSM 40712]MDT0611823.1 lytic murein transglycosylase [Streptomyces sp. DSM 40712]
MPAHRARRLPARTRQGLRATAIAVAAVAALTASQAPGLPQKGEGRPVADDRRAPFPDVPYTEQAPPDDGSYHTELPPLAITDIAPRAGQAARVRAESGIPGTVLRAYRAAEKSVGRTDPGCRLPWELLAAIGKVESGQARGGAVDRFGTTLGRITGPALDGRGFALIRDTDGGVHDGDTVYDRAVGPMQFLPSTWARWGADGNGDGRSDPNNIFDAALAAGHYLCAGERNLSRAGDLDQAILSYNHSRSYLALVRHWLDFYRRGVHTVPDGRGVVPHSPGAGSDTPATEPVDGADGEGSGGKEGAGGEGGIIIGPDPSPSAPSSAPSPTIEPSPSVTGPGPSQSPGQSPGPSPSDTPTADPSPTSSPTGPSTPTSHPGTPQDCPSGSASPSPDTGAPPTADPSTPEVEPTCPA